MSASVVFYDKAKSEYADALGHNQHTEEVSVLLLGFTGVIFTAIFSWSKSGAGANLSLYDGILIDEALIALGLSAVFSALTLVSFDPTVRGGAITLLGRMGQPQSAAEQAMGVEFLLALLFQRVAWLLDDLWLELAVILLGDGLALALISRLDPPVLSSPNLQAALVGLVVVAMNLFLFIALVSRTLRLRGEATRDIEIMWVQRMAALIRLTSAN